MNQNRPAYILHFIGWFLVFFTPNWVNGQTGTACDQLDISVDTNRACSPGIFRFNLSHVPENTAILWDFGLGAVPADSMYEFIQSSAGGVSLTISLKQGNTILCTRTESNIVKVLPLPKPTISISKTHVCGVDDQVVLRDLTKDAKTRTWGVGGQIISSHDDSIQVGFRSVGPQDVMIIVEDSAGCRRTETFLNLANVGSKPNLKILLDTPTVCENSAVQYRLNTNPDLSGTDSFVWTFPGATNTRSTQLLPSSVFYPEAGKYYPIFQLHQQNGCSYDYTTSKPMLVQKPALLQFQISDTFACAPQMVQLDVVGTSGTEPVQWDLGTVLSDSVSPTSRLLKLSLPGTYSFSASQVNGQCVSEVSSKDLVRVENVNVEVQSNRHYDCIAPLNALLFGASKSSESGKVTYDWIVSNQQKVVVHRSIGDSLELTVKSKGFYDVTLIGTHLNGCSDTIQLEKYLRVNDIEPAFSATPENACLNQEVQLLSTTLESSYRSADHVKWWIYKTGSAVVLDSFTTKAPRFKATQNGSYDVLMRVWNDSGCTGEARFEDAFRVIKPQADFEVLSPSVCAGEPVPIISKPQPKADYWYTWEIFGDGYYTNYRTENCVPILNKPGLYDVDLSISILGKCGTSKARHDVIRVNGISAEIIMNSNRLCRNIPLKPTAKCTNYIPSGIDEELSYRWSVEPHTGVQVSGGSTARPQFVFNSNGDYVLTLTVTNKLGCETTVQSSVVHVGTDPDYFFESYEACLGQSIEFENFTDGFADNYSYTITPSGNSTMTDPSAKYGDITFNESGVFTLNIITGKQNFCTDTFSRVFEVQQLSADFNVSKDYFYCAPAIAQFSAKTTQADTFIWYFGDGDFVRSTQSEITHIYRENTGKDKPLTVSLRVISKIGCTDLKSRKNLITIDGPAIDFKVSETSGCEPMDVQFTGTTSNIVKLFIDYGDGSPLGNNLNEWHTYQAFGEQLQEYQPKAILVDKQGCTNAVLSDPIRVYPAPKAIIGLSTTEACIPFQLDYQAIGALNRSISWDLNGDGKENSTLSSGSYMYLNGGEFTVGLKVSNSYCTTSATKILRAVEPPRVHFDLNNPPCPGETMFIVDKSEVDVPVETRKWYVEGLGPGVLSTDSLFKLRVPKIDSMFVTLKVTDEAGCESSLTKVTDLRRVKTNEPALLQRISVQENGSVNIHPIKPTSDYVKTVLYRYEADWVEIQNGKPDDQIINDKNAKPNQSTVCYGLAHVDACDFRTDSFYAHCTVFLSVTKNQDGLPLLEWTKYVGWETIRDYAVYRKTDNGEFKLIKRIYGSKTSYLDNLACTGTHSYYLIANEEKGLQSRSNSASLSIELPRNSSITHVRNVSVTPENQIRLQLESNNVLSKYEVTRTNGTEVEVFEIGGNYFTDGSVDVNHHSYLYTARGFDKCRTLGESGRSGQTIYPESKKLDNHLLELNWNPYFEWKTPVSTYAIYQRNGDDPVLKLMRRVDGTRISEKLMISYDPDTLNCFVVVAEGEMDTSRSSTTCLDVPPVNYVPTAFRPKSEVGNDVFNPVDYFVKDPQYFHDGNYELKIFDRYGHLIFCTQDPKMGWDGRLGKKDKLAMQGVYFYTIAFVGMDNKTRDYSGTVTLLR
ncbi:MAG: gliding motility-associated C-terminal domain-containing protein [Flavobacteriales bacterium]|nr:gliding motility-associated C-terminal domain-containing protein [Flavobacteriales bacterium]